MISSSFIDKFSQIAKSPEPDLATSGLLIAKLEYPNLDASRYLERLDEMGLAVLERLNEAPENDPLKRIEVINAYLYKEEGFTGNKSQLNDPRNNLLNAVIDRKTGIPIMLAVVYIEVARRAGVTVEGVNFPGHFLLRIPYRNGTADHVDFDLIVDPFHSGAILSESDCRHLLNRSVNPQMPFDRRLLMHATKLQIIIRMLVNLKRLYVTMLSFPQARAITELLLALDPSAMAELRDRGLLAYQLNDFSTALKDLQAYLRFTSRGAPQAPEKNEEHSEIWEHVKTLRRRVANLN